MWICYCSNEQGKNGATLWTESKVYPKRRDFGIFSQLKEQIPWNGMQLRRLSGLHKKQWFIWGMVNHRFGSILRIDWNVVDQVGSMIEPLPFKKCVQSR